MQIIESKGSKHTKQIMFQLHFIFEESQKQVFLHKCTEECFPRFCFVVKMSADNVFFSIFWHFHQWIESFFNSIEFLCLNKVNWIKKRPNSWVKMSKICEITLSANVFTTKQKLRKHSTVSCLKASQKWEVSFFKTRPGQGLKCSMLLVEPGRNRSRTYRVC